MAWVAVDKYGNENIFSIKPLRTKQFWEIPFEKYYDDNGSNVYYYHGEDIILPKGTIRKILGYELTWDNDPVQII